MAVPAEQMQRPGMMGQTPQAAGQQLDNAQTARQPQAGDPDEETYTAMVTALRNHIFGKGEQGIAQQLQQADDIGKAMGEVTFALVFEAAEQAKNAGREYDMDLILGVATEVIDDLTDMASALGIEVGDQEREFALLYAQQLYIEQAKPTDDEREVARGELAQQKEDGDVDSAVKYVQMRGAENGTDPFGVQAMSTPGMMGKDRED